MLRFAGALFAGVVAAGLWAGAAVAADCEAECKAGFEVCMRNCGGQSGCLATCSRGHEGCMRRCEERSDAAPAPRAIPAAYSPDSLAARIERLRSEGVRVATGAECPVRSGKYCGDSLPYCCVAADGTAYCAEDTTHCTK